MRKQLSSWFLFHNSKAGLFLIWGHLPWKKITFGFTLRKWAKCKGWPKVDIKVYTTCMLSIEKLSDFFVPKMVRLGIFSSQRVLATQKRFWTVLNEHPCFVQSPHCCCNVTLKVLFSQGRWPQIGKSRKQTKFRIKFYIRRKVTRFDFERKYSLVPILMRPSINIFMYVAWRTC